MDIISKASWQKVNWSVVVMFVLGFWLSSSLLLDSVIIPGLAATGMMSQGGFASAGYLIFGIFNRIELLCGAIALTGCLALRQQHYLSAQQEKWSIVLASTLLIIALLYTYLFTPQMSALGLPLSFSTPSGIMPQGMTMIHESYWVLEIVKLLVGGTLLRWCYRNSCTLV